MVNNMIEFMVCGFSEWNKIMMCVVFGLKIKNVER